MNKSVFGPIIVILISLGITQGISFLVRENNKPIINYLALFAILLQWIVFLHAGGIIFGNERTEKYYDITGSATFLLTLSLSLYFSFHYTLRQLILSGLVGIWTLRLGIFLFTRIHNNNGIDSRFTEIKQNNYRFLMMWTLQGVWVFLCLIPVLIINQKGKSDNHIHILDYIGFATWTFGFFFESIADAQKSKFRSNPDNKDKFISTGLWSISRHPNYFGEIVLWIGIALSAFQGSRNFGVFISPLLSAFFLIFVSGIPPLEKKANEKFGKNAEYQVYKKKTSVLVPFINC